MVGGAVAGGIIGAFGGPGGIGGGAVIGGTVGGGVYGVAEQYMKNRYNPNEPHGWLNPRQPILDARDREKAEAAKLPPLNVTLNVDGQTLAQAIIDRLSEMTTFQRGASIWNGLDTTPP